jgi:hypothetical protein
MPRPTNSRPSPRSRCSTASRSPSKDCCRPGSGRECYLPLPGLSLPLPGLSFPPARSLCALPARLSGRPGGSVRWFPGESLPFPEPAARDGGGWLLGGLAASAAPRPGPDAANAVLVWASSAIRPRAVPMRAPSNAPATTRNWPRRRSDRSTGPPSSNTTLTTLPKPAEPNLGSLSSPCPHDQLAATEVLCLVAWRRPDRRGPPQPESRQRGIPATARAGRQGCGGGAASTL